MWWRPVVTAELIKVGEFEAMGKGWGFAEWGAVVPGCWWCGLHFIRGHFDRAWGWRGRVGGGCCTAIVALWLVVILLRFEGMLLEDLRRRWGRDVAQGAAVVGGAGSG